MTPAIKKATDKLTIARHLLVFGKFKEVESGYQIDYTFYSFPATFHRSPLAMCNLLEQFGFIDSYFATTEAKYVKWTGGDGFERTDLLDEYMEKFSQAEAIMLLTEWQYREQCRKDVLEAVKLSCDAKQFSQTIN